MQKAPQKPTNVHPPLDEECEIERDKKTLRDVVEKTASAYFAACRKIAAAISRIKQ